MSALLPPLPSPASSQRPHSPVGPCTATGCSYELQWVAFLLESTPRVTLPAAFLLSSYLMDNSCSVFLICS